MSGWRPISTGSRLAEGGTTPGGSCCRLNTDIVRSRQTKEVPMADTTVKKVDSAHSPTGEQGQKYLASGKTLSMRLWQDEPPTDAKPPSRRDYETVGYVISGSAELHLEGQIIPRLREMSKKPLARRGRKDSSRHHDSRRLSDSGGTAGPDRAGSGRAG